MTAMRGIRAEGQSLPGELCCNTVDLHRNVLSKTGEKLKDVGGEKIIIWKHRDQFFEAQNRHDIMCASYCGPISVTQAPLKQQVT